MGAGLLGDTTHSMVFDNTKIRRLVREHVAMIGFRQGAAKIIAWYKSNSAAQKVDEQRDQLMETMIAAYESVGPGSPVTS